MFKQAGREKNPSSDAEYMCGGVGPSSGGC